MKNEDVYEVIKKDERFSILSKILDRSGMGEAMANEQKVFTFFAPTDKALSHLSKSALRLLTSPEGKDLAMAMLGRHVIPRSYLYSTDLQRTKTLKPLFGREVRIAVANNVVRYGKAPICTPGIATKNAVVFPIDQLLPLRRQSRPHGN